MDEKKLTNYSIIFIALVVLAIVFKTFQSALRPLAIAVLLTFIFVPFANFLRSKKIPVWLGVAGGILVLALLINVLFSMFSVDAFKLENSLPAFESQVDGSTGGLIELADKFGVELSLSPEMISEAASAFVKNIMNSLGSIFSELLLSLIFLLFLIPSYAQAIKSCKPKLRRTFLKAEDSIKAYLVTKTIMSLGTALVSAVVMIAFGANFVVISSLMIFSLNFIPIVGSLIAVFVVFLLFALTNGVGTSALLFLVLLFLVQVLFGQILEPKIAGKKLSMSPIVIILSLSIWSWIWGIIGALISIPLTVTIKIFFQHFWDKK